MEKLHSSNRQSSIHSIIHREIEHIATDRLYPSSTMTATSVASPTSMYTQPPPPYSSGWPARSISGLLSPPDSRRTSDNTTEHPPPIQTSQLHRPSLPSIHEALTTGSKPKPYPSPVSASVPQSHQLPYSGPQALRSYPSEHAPHVAPPAPAQQLRQPSPQRPVHPPPNTFSRPEQATFPEAPRHPSLQAAPAPQNPYAAPRYEPTTHEQDLRAQDRPPSAYAPQPPPQPYSYGAPPGQMAPLASHAPGLNNPRYDLHDRRGPYEMSKWPKEEQPERFKQGLKRVLESYSFENNLAEINTDSSMIANWSAHYNAILSEQQPSHNLVPDRMPSMESVDDMIRHQEKLAGALQQMKAMIYEQAQNTAHQRMREQSARDDYEMGMYEDDMKSHYGSESKKRRGRAAPPGRCHSCNRAETPEWRRGPDGARTLCNACGLHYAKLTRKNTLNLKQGSSGSGPLRPKSTDDPS
ncbi:hypothetical protein QTJ16_005181 [Diplocarpon rosae]|uniref:GATA-type domain-containing protein n=1 Tax=Diplocarpon rosae TaxID=946125 RepID=A0AAD9SZL3_9HELO|nr:hypothetical protein QTJ16_005181 [Diplocarpon rosae]